MPKAVPGKFSLPEAICYRAVCMYFGDPEGISWTSVDEVVPEVTNREMGERTGS